MRKIIFFPLLMMVVGNLATESSADSFFPYDFELFELDNGLKAFMIPVKGSGLVAYYSIVRTGSRDEYEAGKSGFAHFFEHMMFRGTIKYPGDIYDQKITEMGADANAYTSDDLTVYHLVIPSAFQEKAMDLESDRFRNLKYDESVFKTEAGAVYGEYRKGRVNPYSVLLEELQSLAFDFHTYEHTTMGFENDIKNMPNLYEYSLTFFDRYYRPDNVILLIAGDITYEKTKKLIERYYGTWESGYVPPKIKAEPAQKEERSKVVKYSGKTLPILWLGYKGDAFDPADPMIAAADLLADLAFGKNSDIYKKLVIREQKIQFIDTWFPFNRDSKLLNIYTMIKNEKDIEKVLAEIDSTIQRYQEGLVSVAELEKVKNRARYSFLMNLETPDEIAGNLARFLALTANLDDVNTYFETLASVTAKDLRAAANKYFQKQRRTVISLKGDQ